MTRMRLDQMLVERALVATRSKARDAIKRGQVKVAGAVVTKPATLVDAASAIEVPEEAARYVSRGALKLVAAMNAFGFEAAERICLDVGASTGGFCQVLAERGAAKVYAVDVGQGQLHESLRRDPRVINLEGTDARDLDAGLIAEPVAAIVSDVSFISLTKALGPGLKLAADGAWAAVLIKPQFEVGREGLGKGGVVRDDALRDAAVRAVQAWFAGQPGWRLVGLEPSPILGGSGNREFLLGARYDGTGGRTNGG